MLTIAAVLSAGLPAQAQRLDLAALKCQDFIAGHKDNAGLILMWLEGYFSEENASPIVDFEKMRQDGSKIIEYCSKNPAQSVVNAAELVMSKQ